MLTSPTVYHAGRRGWGPLLPSPLALEKPFPLRSYRSHSSVFSAFSSLNDSQSASASVSVIHLLVADLVRATPRLENISSRHATPELNFVCSSVVTAAINDRPMFSTSPLFVFPPNFLFCLDFPVPCRRRYAPCGTEIGESGPKRVQGGGISRRSPPLFPAHHRPPTTTGRGDTSSMPRRSEGGFPRGCILEIQIRMRVLSDVSRSVCYVVE